MPKEPAGMPRSPKVSEQHYSFWVVQLLPLFPALLSEMLKFLHRSFLDDSS